MRVPNFLLTQTCQISKYLGETSRGPKYEDPYTSICRFEKITRIMRNKEGYEFTSKGRVFLVPSSDNISLPKKSKIALNGEDYYIEEKNDQLGLSQVSHVECIVS